MKKSLKPATLSNDSINMQMEERIAAEIAARITLEIEDAMKPAVVTLTVNDHCFRKVLKPIIRKGSLSVGDPNTKADMKVSHHPRVFKGPETPPKLHIRRGGATIQMKIEPHDYYPIGVAFKLKNGQSNPGPDQRKRIGLLNFESSHMPLDPQTLLITDRFKDSNSDDEYEFSVVIQRVADGEIGIIDPDIVHES